MKALHVKLSGLQKGWELNCKEIINKCLEQNPCTLDVRYDEPMLEHTTFKVGGPADCWVQPQIEGFPHFCVSLLNCAHSAGVSVFILGGGANIAVSDKGIRGIVLDTGAWTGRISELPVVGNREQIIFRSGTAIDIAAECTAAAGLSGLEFLAGMPGSVGGAVWMNARCCDTEMADVLAWTDVIELSDYNRFREGSGYVIKHIPVNKADFSYKRGPFQKMNGLILSAAFNLKNGDKDAIYREMEKNRQDRKKKGHYLFPSAGSAFKNNRDFGKPAGRIIDELGLKGLSAGGAQIAPFHGNFIINTGSATAKDIRTLIDEVTARVRAATGFILEPEILFVGDF